MAKNLHQGQDHMAKRLLTTSSGMGILQAQHDNAEEHVVQRNRIVNFVNTRKPLPNTSFTSNLPYLTIPQYSMPMHTIYPQIPREYLNDPNAWSGATLYQPSFITMPAVRSRTNQMIVLPQELPTKEVEAMGSHNMEGRLHKLKKVIRDESRSRNIQSLCYEDLCIHPDIELPHGYNIPKLNTFDGKGNPYAHLKDYCSRLIGIGNNEALRMRLFIQSLSGMALAWYTKQDFSKWHTWEDMAYDFVEQYKFNIVGDPDLIDMRNVKRMSHESFAEYAMRWRLEASKMHPPLPEDKLMAAFIDMQDGIYYAKMVVNNASNFRDLIQLGKMIEEGIATGKIPSGLFGHTTQSEKPANFQDSPIQFQQAHSDYPASKKRKSDTFTSLNESVTSIFEKLQAKGLLQPRKGTIPKHLPSHFDPLKHCAYHSNIQGHDTEECTGLRYKIQSMIDSGKIIVQEDPLSGSYSIPGTILVKGEASSAQRYSKKKRLAS